MLAVVIPITVFFLILITFFIIVSVGCAPTLKAANPGTDSHVEMVSVGNDTFKMQADADLLSPLGGARRKPVLITKYVLAGLMAYIFVPFVDNMTDLAFLLTNAFYNTSLFICFIIFYCLPSFGLFNTLINKRAVPRFYLVPVPERLLFAEYDSLYKVIVTFITLIPFVILNSPFLIPWTFLGCLLYNVKAFAFRPVSNLWTHVWTGAVFAKEGTALHEQRLRDIEDAAYKPVDDRVLNESLMAHILFETFPITAVQFINNFAANAWTPLGYFSIAFSLFNSCSGVYRIVYYRMYLGTPFAEIPVDFTVFGVYVFGSETAKALLGDDLQDQLNARQQRFSITPAIGKAGYVVSDEWVDAKGHLHQDAVTKPLLIHFAESVLELQNKVRTLEDRLGIQSALHKVSPVASVESSNHKGRDARGEKPIAPTNAGKPKARYAITEEEITLHEGDVERGVSDTAPTGAQRFEIHLHDSEVSPGNDDTSHQLAGIDIRADFGEDEGAHL